MTRHPAYRSWADMLQRCTNERHKWFQSYGGRGVSVAERWSDFKRFWEDMGSTWANGLTIGRIDNNGGYSKENCQWETHKQQQNNKSNSRIVSAPGGQMTASEAAAKYGLSVGCVLYRAAAGKTGNDLVKKSQRARKS